MFISYQNLEKLSKEEGRVLDKLVNSQEIDSDEFIFYGVQLEGKAATLLWRISCISYSVQ